MAVSSISCSLKPPAPFKESSARVQPSPATTTTPAPWSAGPLLRPACVAAAACAVVAMADGGGAAVLARDAVASGRAGDGGAAVAVDARWGGQAPRWSDRRRCPPWRANSLESFVPENLPRPSPQRRFNGVTAAEGAAPALAPDAVAPFLALRSGMGCFSL